MSASPIERGYRPGRQPRARRARAGRGRSNNAGPHSAQRVIADNDAFTWEGRLLRADAPGASSEGAANRPRDDCDRQVATVTDLGSVRPGLRPAELLIIHDGLRRSRASTTACAVGCLDGMQEVTGVQIPSAPPLHLGGLCPMRARSRMETTGLTAKLQVSRQAGEVMPGPSQGGNAGSNPVGATTGHHYNAASDLEE